jgi:hypothetical protein
VGDCGKTKTTKRKKSKKKPWQWDLIHQQGFDNVKAAIAKEVVLAYPDVSKPFKIYMDTSALQWGDMIIEDNRPITFFSMKISKIQQKYSGPKIELLAIVKTLNEFKGMQWEKSITVFADHKNLTRETLGLTSNRVYQWRLILVEYAPEILYIKGIHSTVADTVSWLDHNPKLNPTMSTPTQHLVCPQRRRVHKDGNFLAPLAKLQWKAMLTRKLSVLQWTKCLNIAAKRIKFTFWQQQKLPKTQQANAAQKHLFKRNAVLDKRLEIRLIENTTCVCKDGRLVIAKPLQMHAAMWYHQYLQHPGHTCLKETMSAAMYWNGIHTTIGLILRSCKTFQTNKSRNLSTDIFCLRLS